MSKPLSPARLVVVCDHDLLRDHFRHFLDASRRLTSAMGYVSGSPDLFERKFVEDLDGAITDLILARQALIEATIGTGFDIEVGGS